MQGAEDPELGHVGSEACVLRARAGGSEEVGHGKYRYICACLVPAVFGWVGALLSAAAFLKSVYNRAARLSMVVNALDDRCKYLLELSFEFPCACCKWTGELRAPQGQGADFDEV